MLPPRERSTSWWRIPRTGVPVTDAQPAPAKGGGPARNPLFPPGTVRGGGAVSRPAGRLALILRTAGFRRSGTVPGRWVWGSGRCVRSTHGGEPLRPVSFSFWPRGGGAIPELPPLYLHEGEGKYCRRWSGSAGYSAGGRDLRWMERRLSRSPRRTPRRARPGPVPAAGARSLPAPAGGLPDPQFPPAPPRIAGRSPGTPAPGRGGYSIATRGRSSAALGPGVVPDGEGQDPVPDFRGSALAASSGPAISGHALCSRRGGKPGDPDGLENRSRSRKGDRSFPAHDRPAGRGGPVRRRPAPGGHRRRTPESPMR